MCLINKLYLLTYVSLHALPVETLSREVKRSSLALMTSFIMHTSEDLFPQYRRHNILVRLPLCDNVSPNALGASKRQLAHAHAHALMDFSALMDRA